MKLPILGLLLVCSTALSNAGFEEAAHYSEETGGNALLVWDNGTVRSSLKPGWSLRTAQPVFSITKTLTALAWLHRFEPGAPVGDGLTSSSLLSQTSGLDPGYRELYRSNLEDLHAVAKRIPRISAPEIGFVYGPSHYERLGIALPGKEDVIDFVERGLGIRPATWKRDAKGAPFLSTGARLSAQDLLTAGLVVLNGGRAGPWRRAVPASRMRKALTGTTANPAYGLGFWLNVNASLGDAREEDIERAIARDSVDWKRFALSRVAPPDLVAMAGSRGQRVYVIPSRRLVIVRLGNSRTFRDPKFLRAFFTRRAE